MKKRNVLGRVGIIVLVAMVLSVIGIFSVSASAKMKINKKKATIYVGKTVKLKVKNANKKVKWSSTKKSVATVSKKGKVKGKKTGKATIIAKVGKKKFKCKVTVKKVYKKRISVSVKSSIIGTIKTYGKSDYSDSDGWYYYLDYLDYDDEYNEYYTSVKYIPKRDVIEISLLNNKEILVYFDIKNVSDSYCNITFFENDTYYYGEGYLYKNKINQDYGVSFYDDNFGSNSMRDAASKLSTLGAKYTLSTFDLIMISCGSNITHTDLGFYF